MSNPPEARAVGPPSSRTNALHLMQRCTHNPPALGHHAKELTPMTNETPLAQTTTTKQPGKRQAPKKVRTPKPRYDVTGVIPRKKVSFELLETTLASLTVYARFLSNRSGYAVTPDAMVDRLAAELARDKTFKTFLAESAGEVKP